jgi:7-cyano-7-deazaguanine synthase
MDASVTPAPIDPATARAVPTGTSNCAPSRWKCTVAYDGTAFAGWQIQPNAETVQAVIERRLAEVLKANDIFIGVNALDYSGYPDCRPAFIKAFQTMANLATAAGVSGQSPMTIHTPLIDMTKAQIVRTALYLGLDIDMTFSCYDPTPAGEPCGACDACLLRAKGIEQAQSI